MINTDDESNYWPWRWIHDGKECKTQEDFRNAWLSVDLLNDKTLRTREHKYFNSEDQNCLDRFQKIYSAIMTTLKLRKILVLLTIKITL